MKKSKYSEEQIVRILKEIEAGAKVGGDLTEIHLRGQAQVQR